MEMVTEEFREFVMERVRGLALARFTGIEDWRVPIPKVFKPRNSFFLDWLDAARSRLVEIEAWSVADAKREAEKSYKEELLQYNTEMAYKNGLRKRYEGLLREAKQWIPPTRGHIKLKHSMIERIKDKIDMECIKPKRPSCLTGVEYKQREVEKAKKDINEYGKYWQNEKDIAKEGTEWLRALRVSLK